MGTTFVNDLNIKIIRMWGILLLPQLVIALKILYFRLQVLLMSGFDFFIDQLKFQLFDLPGQLLTIFLTVYFLFFGCKAADLLQYFMNKWQPEYRNNFAAYAIRMLGLILLLKLVKDLTATLIMILWIIVSRQPFIESISFPLAGVSMLLFFIEIYFLWYLLYKGEYLFNIVHRPGIEVKDTLLKSVHCWGLLLLPRFFASLIGFVWSFIYNSLNNIEIPPDMAVSLILQYSNYAFFFAITIYLLLYGKQAAKLLGFFMDKWLPELKDNFAAYFIRILGMHFLLSQIGAIINIVRRITTMGQWHEFKDIYNLPGILKLSSLPEITSIVIWLVIIWYLLYRGRFILNFINRKT